MQRSWMLGGVVALLLASSVWGRPGIVKTRDGQTIAGDVVEQDDQVVIQNRGIVTTIDRYNVSSIGYSDTIDQEYRKRLAHLTVYDVRGRVELAQWLFENKAYNLASDVLQQAEQIQPRNGDVLEMIRTVNRQILLEQSEARKHAPVQLAAADNRAAAGATPAGPQDQPPSDRLLTPAEINEIKQAEWQKGEIVRVTFRDDVRRKYIAKEGMQPGDFNRLPPPQQAWAILQDGTPEMKKDVIIINDPPELTTFRRVQQALLYQGCAGCHTSGRAQGNFALHFPAGEAATYTNYLILQKYQKKIGDRAYAMIDRQRPEDSLMIQFALPLDVGQPPHPKAQNYRGAVRSRSDTRLRTAIEWIGSLTPVQPDYSDIDLSASSSTDRPLTPAPSSRPAASGH